MTRLIGLVFLLVLCTSSPYAQSTKVVYLATVQGIGTDANPFRANGYGETAGQGCIDLRADDTVVAGRMICAADSIPAGGGITHLGDTLFEELTPQRKTAVEAILGVTLTHTHIHDMLLEVLTTHGRNDGTRWRPLKANKDGKYHIYLGRTEAIQTTAWYYDQYNESDGGLRADVLNGAVTVAGWIEDLLLGPVYAWASSYTEGFNCADSSGGSLTCDLTWSEPIGTGTLCGITSNKAACAASGSDLARADSDTATDDMDVQITMSTLSRGAGSDVFFVVFGRKDSSTTNTYYGFEAEKDATTPQFALFKRVAGTRTNLGTDATDPVDGDILKIRMDGSSITGYINGSASSIGTITDTAITGNTRGGFRYDGNDAAAAATADDFSIQDVGQARRRVAPRWYQ